MKRIALISLISIAASAAFAADVPAPVYKAPPPTVAVGGFYVSLDGSWQRVELPNYTLGHHFISQVTGGDLGQLSIPQRIDGYLVRGTAGYFLPVTTTVLGSNTRIELGAQYGHASGSGSATRIDGNPSGGVISQLLDGTTSAGGVACNPGQVCTITGTASSNFTTWNVHGRAAGDYRFGAVSVTPSVAVFGGEGRNNQSTTSIYTVSTAPAPRASIYDANTSLHWTDVGARAGVDFTVGLSSAFSVGVGGWIGGASRRATLSGSDSYLDTILGFYNGASTITGIARDTTAYLANVEGGVAFKPTPNLMLRAFGGANFDSSLPGVASPTMNGFPTTVRTPAGISFNSQISYYAGGGLTWAFAPLPVAMSALGR
jgi:hypothetical protein